MSREEAILIILKQDVKLLAKDERETMLLNSWGIRDENCEFKLLSESLQKELLQSSEPAYDVMDKRYDQLLLFSMSENYKGMINEYLSKLVSKILNEEIIVEGQPEELFTCPCCGYKTLDERGGYDICLICFWEDDGSDDPLQYSGPNHMTLSEGRSNYKKYGAMRKEVVKFVYSGDEQIYYK